MDTKRSQPKSTRREPDASSYGTEPNPIESPPEWYLAETAAAYGGSPAGDGAPAAFLTRLSYEVVTHLEPLLRLYQTTGRSLAELGTPAELAARMVAVLPGPSPWNEALGPFYSTQQVSRLLGGVSRQAIAERRERRTLLALRTADGVWVYPTFQFGANHRVLPGLADILQTLAASGVDDWTLAGWLRSPLASLSGSTPIDWLRAERDGDTLKVVARDATRRFAQ
jgi:hypothetical protein